jgi:hypothetical protein
MGDRPRHRQRPLDRAANRFAARGLEPDEGRRRNPIAAVGLGPVQRLVGLRPASLAMATPTLTVGLIGRSANCRDAIRSATARPPAWPGRLTR